MCHLFFALPLLALPVFWLSPLSVALPLYGVAAAVSLLAYAYAWKAWRMPRMNGLDAMPGMQGKVVVKGAREVTLLVHGELWSARADGEELAVGDTATVVAAEGLMLRVRRGAVDPRQAGPPACRQVSIVGRNTRSGR